MGARAAWVAGVFVGCLQLATAQAERLEASVGLAPSWEAAVERARREDRLVLAYVQHYPGFGVPDLLRGVVLADEDVCALIEERFVLVRVSRDVPTPLHDRPRYGLSSTTFGRALLVLTPEAQVLAETERLHPVHVDAFLRGVLAEHGSHASAPEGEPLARARVLARRGDLEASLALLEPLAGAPAHLARARVLRRLRRPDDALQAL
ncbi:MAG: hypothetical protein KDD82_02175, partial [Planctomycetes bacterium]|nr:hypothetical protein [Planctomycetota bacterium]